jgi:LPXTG-motif cell wall-anchored protein
MTRCRFPSVTTTVVDAVFGDTGLEEETVMFTKPMKTLVALASIALLGSLVNAGSAPALANGGCGLTPVDANSPGTAGTSSNPWKVTSAQDFALVGDGDGDGDCGLDGHYLQTASFSVDTSISGARVDDLLAQDSGDVIPFSGVYNGDHWQITLAGESDRPPFSTVSGTIKKLRISGNMSTDGLEAGSLVQVLEGGVISEVGSTVTIISEADGPSVGGLVALVWATQPSLIQYSYFSSSISFTPWGEGTPSIGGLVGTVAGPLTVRDSYARAEVVFGSEYLDIGAGGILGFVAGSAPVQVVRTYAAGSFTNVCDTSSGGCDPDKVYVGGLVGWSQRAENNEGIFVSNFWLQTMATASIGEREVGVADLLSYNSSFPIAVPLNQVGLRDITSFQSKGSGTTPNLAQPLPQPGSTRLDDGSAPLDIDYRWAIEFADISPFVAQKRQTDAVPGETVTYDAAFDRVSWANSPVPLATYSTRGTTSSSDSYPPIGRVWEICSNLDVNDGFPVLVWEGYNCPGEGTGGGVANSGANQAHASGLTGAELTAFLASGLTLEQWLAQRLAATGTSSQALWLGIAGAVMLTAVGLGLVVARRRLRDIGVR